MQNVATGLIAGIAAAVEGLETSMIEITDIGASPTPAPVANPTSAPDENATAPTPAPVVDENQTAERRLSSGEMTVAARLSGVPATVTKYLVESKASDIETEIAKQLSSVVTVSGLTVTTMDTPAPTPAPKDEDGKDKDDKKKKKDAGIGADGAFGARL